MSCCRIFVPNNSHMLLIAKQNLETFDTWSTLKMLPLTHSSHATKDSIVRGSPEWCYSLQSGKISEIGREWESYDCVLGYNRCSAEHISVTSGGSWVIRLVEYTAMWMRSYRLSYSNNTPSSRSNDLFRGEHLQKWSFFFLPSSQGHLFVSGSLGC
jgi:hypothetical protein